MTAQTAERLPSMKEFLRDIDDVFEPQGGKEHIDAVDEEERQEAKVRENAIMVAVGTAGKDMADAMRAVSEACGLGLISGYIDLVDIRHLPPFIQPLPGLRYPVPEHYVLGENSDSLETARHLYGEAWEREMHGIPFGELSLRHQGGAGYPAISRAYLRAEERQVKAFLRKLFKRLRQDERAQAQGGFGDWGNRFQERRRIRVVIAAGTAGCVGRGISLTVLALARQVADEEGFDIDPFIVAVGGLPYGEAGVPVHERIAENARTWLDEVNDTVNFNRVRFGAGHLQLPTPALLTPASILYVNEEISGEDGEVSQEARQAYLTQAGLTAAAGMFSGALDHANTIDAVLAPADAVIRRARIYGHGIDRGQVAALLNETRSTRLWQVLLNALQGNAN